MRRISAILLVLLSAGAYAGWYYSSAEEPEESPYLLDGVDNEAHAWSVAAEQRAAYAGNLFRVRRSSDNTEQDIGVDANGIMNQSALLSFVGAGNGFVVTIYDQVGSQNLTQATAGNQPQIVSSGSVITDGEQPAMLFDGSADYLAVANGGTPNGYPVTMIAFVKPTVAQGANIFQAVDTGSATDYIGIGLSGTGVAIAYARNNTYTSADGTTNLVSGGNRRMISGVFIATGDWDLYVGASVEDTNTTAVTWMTPNGMAIGRYNDTTPDSYFAGYISDVFYIDDEVTSGEISAMVTAWE